MAKGNSSMIVLLIVCCCLSSVLGVSAWFLGQPKPGDICEGSDQFGNYTIDAEGNCTLESCNGAYRVSGDICLPKEIDPIVNPPPEEPVDVGEVKNEFGRTYAVREYVTDPDEDGGGKVTALNRHNVTCGDDALNRFQLQRKADDTGNLNKFTYDVGCLEGVNSGTGPQQRTSAYVFGLSNARALERHEVDCGTTPIAEFQLENPNSSQIQYRYKCSTLEHTGDCRNLQTNFSEDGDGSAYNLDRHDVKCAADEAMTSFKLVRNPIERRNTEGDRVAYEYTCCKMPE